MQKICLSLNRKGTRKPDKNGRTEVEGLRWKDMLRCRKHFLKVSQLTRQLFPIAYLSLADWNLRIEMLVKNNKK